MAATGRARGQAEEGAFQVGGAGRGEDLGGRRLGEETAVAHEQQVIAAGGLVVPRAAMTPVLSWLSDILPLSYAVDAMQRIAASAAWTAALTADVAVIAAFTAAALVGGALTLRRRTR